MHVHVSCPDGEAKFWLEPIISLYEHFGLTTKQLKEMHETIEEHKNEIVNSWKKHFSR
jgi:hypothetical protein